MKITDKKLMELALIGVERWSNIENMLSAVQSQLYKDRALCEDVALQGAFSTIMGAIRTMELHCLRRTFMLALAVSDEERVKIRALAYRQFLEASNSVSHLLNPDGITPDLMWGEDVDELRGWLKENFSDEGCR